MRKPIRNKELRRLYMIGIAGGCAAASFITSPRAINAEPQIPVAAYAMDHPITAPNKTPAREGARQKIKYARIETVAGKSPNSARKKGWVLTFDDEFNGPALDTSKWSVDDKEAAYNGELEYYTPDDVSIHKGALRLTSEKRDLKGRHFTSGMVNSHGKFAQCYGLFEIRAKLPGTRGLWPAIWLLPEDSTWPPEIDIMELLGHEPNIDHMTNHYLNEKDAHLQHGKAFTGPDFTKGFHTFVVDWEPDKITWLVDGIERSVSTEGVPNKPFYIILNSAVGGFWPGNPDATTVFPQFHDIDYVRVYKRADQPSKKEN